MKINWIKSLIMEDTYVVYQQVVTASDGNNATVDVLIRFVKAINKDEAIGKFITQTAYYPAVKKLDVVCYPLSEQIKIE